MNTSEDPQVVMDLMRELTSSINKGIECSLPCVVTAVTSRGKVSVKPLIKVVAQDGAIIDRAIIEGVPVFTAGGGGFFVSFPVAIGDFGWIDASDRDIGLFLQNYEASEPTTKRMHSFSDSRFIPDIMTNYTVSEEDATALVIQNRTGTVKISVGEESIKVINGSSTVDINSSEANINGVVIKPGGIMEATSFILNGKEIDGHEHEAGLLLDGDGAPVTGTTGANV